MIQDTTSVAIPLSSLASVKTMGVTLNITVNTPAAGTFTDAVSDILTKAAHDFTLGLVVRVSNSGGALPTGLAAATDYFVIPIDVNTFYLATSLANAKAGTAIDITGAGTGTQTVTPSAISATYKPQVSISGDINEFVDLATSTAISATAGVLIEKIDPSYNYVRMVYTVAAGRLSVIQNVNVKGETV